MKSRSEFEHLSSVVRIWIDGGTHGDPYDWSCVVRWITRTEVELILQQKKLNRLIYNKVMAACYNQGIETIIVRTFPNGSGGCNRVRRLSVIKWFEKKERRL